MREHSANVKRAWCKAVRGPQGETSIAADHWLCVVAQLSALNVSYTVARVGGARSDANGFDSRESQDDIPKGGAIMKLGKVDQTDLAWRLSRLSQYGVQNLWAERDFHTRMPLEVFPDRLVVEWSFWRRRRRSGRAHRWIERADSRKGSTGRENLKVV